MHAIAACQRLLSLSKENPLVGTVHSVFDHAVNLELGHDGLIGLIAEHKALTPYAVLVRTNAPFAQTGVRAGMAAYLQDGGFRIPAAGVTIDLCCAKPVDLSVDSILLHNVSAAKDVLAESITESLVDADAENSLAPLVTGGGENIYTRFLAPRLSRFFTMVSAGEWDKAAEAAGDCAGCGMGLTPSSDDLLSGYFLTLHLLLRAANKPEPKAKIDAMARVAAEKTNRISGTFLLQSGQALANSALWDLFFSAFSADDDTQVRGAIRRVRDIGSTSGADMLTGVVLALRQHNAEDHTGSCWNFKRTTLIPRCTV